METADREVLAAMRAELSQLREEMKRILALLQDPRVLARHLAEVLKAA